MNVAGSLRKSSEIEVSESFAEYHSKRNLVERVHTVQNHALSNEQFSSTVIYSKYTKEDEKHKANMEHMAEEVRRCLANTQFGGKPCTVMRGIDPQKILFLVTKKI